MDSLIQIAAALPALFNLLAEMDGVAWVDDVLGRTSPDFERQSMPEGHEIRS